MTTNKEDRRYAGQDAIHEWVKKNCPPINDIVAYVQTPEFVEWAINALIQQEAIQVDIDRSGEKPVVVVKKVTDDGLITCGKFETADEAYHVLYYAVKDWFVENVTKANLTI